MVPNPDLLSRAYPTMHRLVEAQAVLAPLCGLKTIQFPPNLETTRALRRLWQSWLPLLRNAGWSDIRKPLAFAYAANCPCHAFAKDGTGRRPCNQYRICPFCYAIQVALVYENVLRTVRHHSGKIDLYLTATNRVAGSHDLEAALAMLPVKGLDLVGSRPPLGIMVRTTISPYLNSGSPPDWALDMVVVRRAALIAMPVDQQPTGERQYFKVPITTLGLARAVAHLTRYPVSLLYGDPNLTVRVLDSIAGRHLGVTRGIFRSARSAAAIEQCREQPLGPSFPQQLPTEWISEEERLVTRIADNTFDHRGYIAGKLQSWLPTATDFPMHWLGQQPWRRYSEYVGQFSPALYRLSRQHRGEGHHAFVFLADGMYLAASTLPWGCDWLPPRREPYFSCLKTMRRGDYVVEPLGQFFWRLKMFLNRSGSDYPASAPGSPTPVS